MLTTNELITDIQTEVGECSSASLDLIGHLTTAESCEDIDTLKTSILEAKGVALLILSNLNDQLYRIRTFGMNRETFITGTLAHYEVEVPEGLFDEE